MPTIQRLEEAQLRDLVGSHYGLEGEWKALPSYQDQNFRLDAGASTYVVKITRQSDHAAGFQLENAVMRHCGELRLCPDVVPSLRGSSKQAAPEAVGGTPRVTSSRLRSHEIGENAVRIS